MDKGSDTRSSLLWEVERLLNEVEHLPQVLLMENVTQVHSASAKPLKDEEGNLVLDEKGNAIYEKSNYENFCNWINFLESKGYSNFYQDLNAKDFGVAQNRDRCFMVSILGDYNYKFPQPIPLEKCMKDYLEENVDKKYYITSEKARNLIDKLILDGKILTADSRQQTADSRQQTADSRQLTYAQNTQKQKKYADVSKQDMMQESQTSNMTTQECVKLGNLQNNTNHQSQNVYSENSKLAPTIMAGTHGYGMGYIEECKNLNMEQKKTLKD